MNIIKDPYEDFWEYLGPENVVVLQTTLHTKRNGELSVVHPRTKEAFNKFPHLKQRWGYYNSIGISYPTYRSSDMILLGLPTREKYNTSESEMLIQSSLVYLADLADEMPNELFYLEPLGSIDMTVDFLGASKNIVLLDYEGNTND